MSNLLGALDRTIQKSFLKNSPPGECDMRIVGRVEGEFSEVLDGLGLRLERMYSSANKNDCLMHAFMNATVPNFRRLCEAKKNEVADLFRRKKFLQIAKNSVVYEKQTDSEKAAIERRITTNAFLENIEVNILCEYYSVKVIVFERLQSSVGATHTTIIYGSSRNTRNTDSVYMLYNPGQLHFEAVRNVGTNNYTLPYSTANGMSEMMMSSMVANVSACNFSMGDKVIYRGEEYYIVDRIFVRNSTNCASYRLSKDSSGAKKIKNAQNAKVNSRAINSLINSLSEIEAIPEEVSAAAS